MDSNIQTKIIPARSFGINSLLNILISIVCILASNSNISLAQNTYNAKSDYLQQLESSVWTSNDYLLPELETKVIRLLQENPTNSFYHYLMSHLSIRMLAANPSQTRLMDQASTLAQQAIDLSPKSEYGYLALAELLDLMGQPEKGISLIHDAKAAGMTASWRSSFAVARLSLDNHPSEYVLNLFYKCLSEEGSLYPVIAPYAAALIQSKYGDKSEEILEQWDQKFPNNMFKLLIAIKNTEKGKYNIAHAIYRKIIASNPEYTEAMINDAILLYKDLNQAHESIELFKKIDTAKHSDIPPSTKSIIYAHMGAALLKSKAENEAKEKFLLAMKFASNLGPMTSFISENYKQAKENNKLIALLKEANFELPGNAILHAYLGEFYSETMGDHKSSLEFFANAITLEPERSEYYNAMGLAYYRLKNFAEALKLFTAATTVNPVDATGQYNKACILAKLGEHDNALTALKSAIELDPSLEATAALDEDFSSIKNHPNFIKLLNKPHITAVSH
ncbi:MAG: tetratricopeptide repeat protein [Bdellovibrionota bacterium]